MAKVIVNKMLARIEEETLERIDIWTQNELAELVLKSWNKPLKSVIFQIGQGDL